MSDPLAFDLRRPVGPGVVERVRPLIRRLGAGNEGPTTFTGTNTYIVGEGTVAIIDPGPRDDAHLERVLAAVKDETVSHILVTHTHLDHSPLARPLARITGAPVLGFAPHRAVSAAEMAAGIDAGGDREFVPDRTIADGEGVEGQGWALEAVHTPGHTSNHLCFALAGTGELFSGDHVMGWSTTMVAPPDGEMGAYLASLRRLIARNDTAYWPGHGGAIEIPGRYARALLDHRLAREAAILSRLRDRPATATEIASRIYSGLAPKLVRAAALTTLAHLVHLAEQGLAEAPDVPTVDGLFTAKG